MPISVTTSFTKSTKNTIVVGLYLYPLSLLDASMLRNKDDQIAVNAMKMAICLPLNVITHALVPEPRIFVSLIEPFWEATTSIPSEPSVFSVGIDLGTTYSCVGMVWCLAA